MPDVSGKIRVGFEIANGTKYFTDLNDTQREQFKTELTNEIAEKVPLKHRNTWDAVNVIVSAAPLGFKAESGVEADLTSALGAANAKITIENPASFEGVRYLHWDSVRECEHIHRLNYDGNAWEVPYSQNGAVKARIVAQLMWPTNI